ncbi:recombinase family protein [Flavobacterium akiainvivens]|uniref:recombinase family protein n=1 Tax=Flavobacterium akiainvivens TaxID=1202724 RepID=UPI0008E3593E|nr:recombinase family protein [Flavobacterium akiainvivens]SFQ77826.1 Site-specific DNA recombinase [Flavobacterium akiainvivens]
MKRAIRYLRFSQLGQSNGSIERQEMYTDQYLQYNNIQLVDTFIDRGKSAKTFDRPDFIKLQAFIAKHYKSVDYLLVDQLDRFSRDAGEAMNMVKQFQRKYSIQIISVTEGIIFDYDTPGSFFRAGLQLLLAEEDNINRSIKVRGGLYTARAKEGRFLTREKPFGYVKVGEGKQRHLEVNELEAKVVREIYDMFLRDVPLYKIKEAAYEMGFDRKGNMAVDRVLVNPVYAGLVRVEPFKDLPGGLFPAVHEPIVDKATWQMVQSKMKKVDKVKVVVDDEIPLRGVVKCHCGVPLTGAPSRGKSGKYFYYYKCKHSKHNNISAIKAHEQFLNACNLMSIPEKKIKEIRNGCYASIEEEMKNNRKKAVEKKRELEEVKQRLHAVEEKWFKDEINKDTYDRWYSTYSDHILSLTAAVERLNINPDKAFELLDNNLGMLSDVRYIYDKATTLQKREFVNKVFDGNLYYQEGIYRTPTMLDLLSHNASKMEEKGYLIYNKKRDNLSIIPQSGR